MDCDAFCRGSGPIALSIMDDSSQSADRFLAQPANGGDRARQQKYALRQLLVQSQVSWGREVGTSPPHARRCGDEIALLLTLRTAITFFFGPRRPVRT